MLISRILLQEFPRPYNHSYALRGSLAKSGAVHFASEKKFLFILSTLKGLGTQVTKMFLFLADDLFLLRYRLDLVKANRSPSLRDLKTKICRF